MKYATLSVEEPDEQSRRKKAILRQIPWPTIRLALGLLLSGIALLIFGILHLTLHIVGKDGAGWSLVLLGALAFIPGFHQTRMAYYSWRERAGYKFEDMVHVR